MRTPRVTQTQSLPGRSAPDVARNEPRGDEPGHHAEHEDSLGSSVRLVTPSGARGGCLNERPDGQTGSGPALRLESLAEGHEPFGYCTGDESPEDEHGCT
jgi:hypothetical protein